MYAAQIISHLEIRLPRKKGPARKRMKTRLIHARHRVVPETLRSINHKPPAVPDPDREKESRQDPIGDPAYAVVNGHHPIAEKIREDQQLLIKLREDKAALHARLPIIRERMAKGLPLDDSLMEPVTGKKTQDPHGQP
jgi:hypothetical protein